MKMHFSFEEMIATGIMAPVLAWLVIEDFRNFRIPDAASFTLIVLGLMSSFFLELTDPADALIGLSLGFGRFFILGHVYFSVRGEDGLGIGDAKLLGAAGAWLGWRDLPMLVALAAIAALSVAMLTRHRKIAFGPWLAAAFWTFWILRVNA